MHEVSTKMEYIQNLFLRIQGYMQHQPALEDLMAFLDSEPPEFRSVAYESASMEVGFQDLSNGTELNEWKKLYTRSWKAHSFHLDIGLGWAYAKTATLPAPNWESLHPLMRWMVFDGMGYYYGLFRGRRTVKNHIVPAGIEGEDRQGFDQGLGRRLWYIAKGEVKEIIPLIQTFPFFRYPDLWRGVGIACGYVGGNKQEDLELLLTASAECKQQLCAGIALAAVSRSTSDSVTDDIKTACRVLCEMPLEEIIGLKTKIANNVDPKPAKLFKHWITELEAEFV